MSEAKFRQIADTITTRIIEGRYPAGSKLPTHREMATELATTPATVAKAYKLLTDLNKVESFVGRGTFVCGGLHLASVIRAEEKSDEFNFSILQPCLVHNAAALQQAYSQARWDVSLLGYSEQSGHQTHRQNGAKWAQAYGLDHANQDNILLTNGAQHALSLIVETLTQPGDTIAVEALTYPGILAIASLFGRRIVAVEMDADGMRADSLSHILAEHQPKLVVVVPSHHNPTGITMPIHRREAIAKVVQASSAWLVEDDIYGFLNPEPISAISNWIPQQSFHITSLSKAISPAMRCGFLKVPDHYIDTLSTHIRATIWMASPLNYVVASDLIQSGEAFAMAEKQKALAVQRQTLAKQILGTDTQGTGYHIWLPLPDGWQQDKLVIEAKKQGILISSGGYFTADQHDSQYVRLALTTIATEKKFEQGLQKLRVLLDNPARVNFPV